MNTHQLPDSDHGSTEAAVLRPTVERRYRGRTRSELEDLFKADAADMAVRGREPSDRHWKIGYRPLKVMRIGVVSLIVLYRGRPGTIAPRPRVDPGERLSSLFWVSIALLVVIGSGLVLAVMRSG